MTNKTTTKKTVDALGKRQMLADDLPVGKLAGRNLSGAKFTRTDLAGANFTGANLTDCSFEGLDLSGAIFTDAKLDGCNFTGANLTKAKLRDGWGTKVGENGLVLSKPSPFYPSKDAGVVKCADFTSANMTEADLSYGYYVDCDFSCAVLDSVYSESSSFSGCEFYTGRANAAHFTGCKFTACIFQHFLFKETDFTASVFEPLGTTNRSTDATFDYCNMTDAYFARAKFINISLEDTIFSGCDFSNAAFTNTFVTRCNFNGAIMRGCGVYGTPKFMGSTFVMADLESIEFGSSTWQECLFHGANLAGCDIDVDLSKNFGIVHATGVGSSIRTIRAVTRLKNAADIVAAIKKKWKKASPLIPLKATTFREGFFHQITEDSRVAIMSCIETESMFYIGCFEGSADEACAAIKRDYTGRTARETERREAYIATVRAMDATLKAFHDKTSKYPALGVVFMLEEWMKRIEKQDAVDAGAPPIV